jgi:hypothetical protein
MDAAIATIVDFVEGRISPAEFEQPLYHDPAIENALNDDPALKPGTYVGSSTYLFVIEQDFKCPGGVLSVHGALSEFLDRKGVPYRATKAYAEFFDIILKAQPRWLNVRADWLQRNVLDGADGRTGRELQDWLRVRLLELFRYRDKPPKWIQSPNWPIAESGPLVFLGQMKITDYFHDEAAVYVFHDPATGRCETVIQVY